MQGRGRRQGSHADQLAVCLHSRDDLARVGPGNVRHARGRELVGRQLDILDGVQVELGLRDDEGEVRAVEPCKTPN